MKKLTTSIRQISAEDFKDLKTNPNKIEAYGINLSKAEGFDPDELGMYNGRVVETHETADRYWFFWDHKERWTEKNGNKKRSKGRDSQG